MPSVAGLVATCIRAYTSGRRCRPIGGDDRDHRAGQHQHRRDDVERRRSQAPPARRSGRSSTASGSRAARRRARCRSRMPLPVRTAAIAMPQMIAETTPSSAIARSMIVPRPDRPGEAQRRGERQQPDRDRGHDVHDAPSSSRSRSSRRRRGAAGSAGVSAATVRRSRSWTLCAELVGVGEAEHVDVQLGRIEARGQRHRPRRQRHRVGDDRGRERRLVLQPDPDDARPQVTSVSGGRSP